MKKHYLLLLLVPLSMQVIAQTTYSDDFRYKAVYQLTYQPDSTDASSVTTEECGYTLGTKDPGFQVKGRR